MQKRDLLVVELRAHPLEGLIRRRAVLAGCQLALGVAAKPEDAVAQLSQPVERLRREQAGRDIAADDDQGVVRHIGEYRLEGREIAVDVVERRDLRHAPVSLTLRAVISTAATEKWIVPPCSSTIRRSSASSSGICSGASRK